jgi:hypothetical protein
VPPTIQLAILQAENESLRKQHESDRAQIARLTEDVREKDARLEALRAMLGASGTDLESMKAGFEARKAEVREAARRGSPKCTPSNTLAEVVIDGGKVAVTILMENPGILSDLASRGGGDLHVGTTLTDSTTIEAFLGAVSQYYGTRTECRFDYRLSYGTAEDYKLGRTEFERYFYPVRITPIQK